MSASPARHRVARSGDSGPNQGFWLAKNLLAGADCDRSPRRQPKAAVAGAYAVHIGRVGALAVMLGVGMGIASSMGVAYAEDSGADSSSSSDAGSASGPGKPSGGAQTPSGSSSGASDSTSPDTTKDDTTKDTTSDADAGGSGATGGTGATGGSGASGGSASGDATDPTGSGQNGSEEPDTSPSDGVTDEPTTPPSETPTSTAPTNSGSAQSAGSNTAPTPEKKPVEASTTASAVAAALAASGRDTVAEGVVAKDDAGASASKPSPSVATETVSTTTPVQDAAKDTAPESARSTNVVAAVASALVTTLTDTGSPAGATWFTALMAWVQREIMHTFFNKTPIANSITTEQVLGQVFIDLRATDPNGDPLTYKIIQPENGFVYQDLITGKFVYTPKTLIVTGEPLHDTLKIIISDSAQTHLPGFLGTIQGVLESFSRMLGLAQPDDLMVSIPITVNPIHLAPLVTTIGTPSYTLQGSPVKVLASATIIDGDSTELSGATVKLTTLSQSGDVLAYVAPSGNPITGTWDAGTKTLSLTGTATLAQYEEALKAVTFSATQGALLVRGVEIWVTDTTDTKSLTPGLALVNVFSPLAPAIGTVGAPSYTLQGAPVKVLASVTITDGDSTTMSGASVKLTTLSQSGDVLGYVAPSGNPITGTWDAATKTLTLTGSATIAQYEEALKAVTFSATQGALLVRGVEVWVTDSTSVQSIAPGVALVNVFSPLAPAVGTVGAPTFTLEGAPVKVLSSVTITDGDSTTLSGATVKLTTLSQSGDVLGYVAPSGNPITGTWDAATKTLTLTGSATIAQYEEALKAVTFSATQGALLVRGVEVWVTDSTNVQSIAPGVALVNVLAPIRLAPLVTTVGTPSYTLQGAPVTVLSSVTITDGDSTTLSGATVKLTTLSQSGDVLGYVAPSGNPITGTWDAATKTLTLTGSATIAQYEEALKAVTFSATQGALLVRGVEVWATDSTNVQSIAPGVALVNVFSPLAPAVGTVGAPTFTLEGAPVKVLASVTITDGDSTTLSGATVKLTTLSQSGDVLAYVAPSGNPITGTWDAATKTLTLTGSATIAQYEEALKAVTFSATQGALLVRGVEVWVTDSTSVQSIAPGVALVNVLAPIRLAPAVGTVGAPTFTLEGAPVTVLSSVTITDGDSTTLSGATVKLTTLSQSGDVLGYVAPSGNPITGTWDAATKTLTLTGSATIAQYEEALKAVTFSATQGALLVRGVEVWVTDSTNVQSIAPGVALVNVLAPIRLAPAVGTVGAPTFTLEGAPVTVLSSVTITDGDSTTLSGATVKLTTLSQSGDVLGYVAPSGNPITGTWDAATKTLTLTGSATIAQYEEALKAVTFSATQGALLVRGVEVWVTDSTNVESIAPGVALVNVLAPIRLAPAVGTVGAPTFTIGGSPVTVLSSVTITDGDSTTLSGATVKLTTLSQSGDVLGYVAPSGNPITGTWDAATKTLTLTGAATIAQYEEALKAVTFSATQGAALVRGVQVWVTDSTNVESIAPGIALVNVNAALLMPLVSTLGAPNYVLGKPPVHLLSSVTITDGDSANMSGAVVKISTLGQSGDVLGYVAPSGNPITGTWDAATKTLTLSGTGTQAQYEEALKAITFSATQGAALVRGFSISVTDSTGLSSGWSGAATATVANPLPPAVGTIGAPTFTIGGSPVTVLASVTITDGDSTSMSGASVKLTTLSQSGDVLGYVAPSGNPITGTWDAATKTLTLTGAATIAQYEEALKAVTFSATQGAALVRGVQVWVTDETSSASLTPGLSTINVNAAPLMPLVSTLGAPNYVLGKPPVHLLSSVTITDGDSANMSGAVVKISTLGQSGDVLGYVAPSGNPITGTWDAATKTLTLSGTGTQAQYEEALKAITFSATQGAALVRGFSISVTDSTGLSSGWSGAATATVANPLPPAVGTIGAPTFTIGGSPATVLASVTITDGDSTTMSGATVKISSLAQNGDVLAYTAPSGNPITATWNAGTKTLTLTGAATIAQYEEALKAVTFTATQGAALVRGVQVWVTDETASTSLTPGLSTINVNAAPLMPLVSTLGAPNYVIGKPPVLLLSSVTITDADSANMSGAAVKINTFGQSGDVLGYVAPSGNPITGTWDAATKTLTLSGTGTQAQYEEALKAITFSATQGAALVRGFLVSVTDNTGLSSGWSGAATATVANPVPPILAVAGVSTYIIGKPGTTIIPSLTISDSDSTVLTGAKVTISSLAQSGDVLSYTPIGGNPITATWDSSSKTLTLSGTATLDQYKTALQAITFTATGGAALVRGVSVVVTDETSLNSVSGLVTVNVFNPVGPAIAVAGGPSGKLNGPQTKVVSSATITDADSAVLTGATVRISVSAQSNDTLYFAGIAGIPVSGSYNSATKTLTLTGTATKAQYESVIEAVTWSSTQAWGLVRSFEIRVTDDSGLTSPFGFVSIAPY